MNAHDWTRVDDGIFHDFHQTWTIMLKVAIRRLLPADFYVIADPRVDLSGMSRSRSLSIRHSRGHQVAAFVEILSPSNKNTEDGVEEVLDKAVGAICAGIHVAVIDTLPPTRRVPRGVAGLIEEELTGESEPSPEGKPLAFASYKSETPPVAYVQRFAAGEPVPDLPLFLTPEYYLDLPLARTYAEAFEQTPDFAKLLLRQSLST